MCAVQNRGGRLSRVSALKGRSFIEMASMYHSLQIYATERNIYAPTDARGGHRNATVGVCALAGRCMQ